jgi:histidinol-phosphate aminotransferase
MSVQRRAVGVAEAVQRAITLPAGFTPYVWALDTAELAARHGLRPEQIVRFDQNTSAFAGVPQIPLAESFARLNEYPDGTYRELCEAAAAYVGADVGPDQIVIGAGADQLIYLCARTFLTSGRRAAISKPTYVVYEEATQLTGATWGADTEDADLVWRCNPNNPTGAAVPAHELVALAADHPGVPVVVDEAYVEFGGESVVPFLAEAPNLIVLRTMSKAFGFASLRVGFAVAAPEVAALLEERREPAPVAGPAARIAAAALREPRLDVESVVAERERVRDSLLVAGYDVPPTATNFLYVRTDDDGVAGGLEAQGLIVRTVSGGFRITLRGPSDDDLILRALGGEPGAAGGRSATVLRTTTETALRITLDLDGSGKARIATGIGFLDHLLTLLAFHAGFDLEVLAGGDLDVDEHHTVEDVLASFGDALTKALDRREGVTRYGSATVPMDEARATAAVDLVRRPHAEIELAFSGDRVGGLALTLLPHALERFAMQAGCTVHVVASGNDDHHVAEAAFKALGRALREACAIGDSGIRSTKGEA